MWCCIRNGYFYTVEQGSYKGQLRKQLEYAVIIIDEPGHRPLAVKVPEGLGFASPTSEEKIHNYFANYLMSDVKPENTQYTYGQYIVAQIDQVINKLKNSNGNTNQATITIGNEKSIYLEDPPCLRLIDFKIVNGKLNMNLFFRSWDIITGLPENLGGLQLIKEYVLSFLDGIKDGKIICYSSGAHIYEMYFPLVNMLNINKIKVK
ncbi:MAG: thymidylate synthase [Candidatus Omnitrophota bacterium]